MKHTLKLLTALLLAPLAALHAAEALVLQPPHYVGAPQAAHFLPVALEGKKTLACRRAGTVFRLTPLAERNNDTQAQALKDQGFEKVALPEVRLFGGSPGNFCALFQKDCAAGETILVGKWAVPLFVP